MVNCSAIFVSGLRAMTFRAETAIGTNLTVTCDRLPHRRGDTRIRFDTRNKPRHAATALFFYFFLCTLSHRSAEKKGARDTGGDS